MCTALTLLAHCLLIKGLAKCHREWKRALALDHTASPPTRVPTLVSRKQHAHKVQCRQVVVRDTWLNTWTLWQATTVQPGRIVDDFSNVLSGAINPTKVAAAAIVQEPVTPGSSVPRRALHGGLSHVIKRGSTVRVRHALYFGCASVES